MSDFKRIRWREPFGSRARLAREHIRHAWLFMVLRGVSIPLVGTVLLVIWCRETGEPFRPVLALLLVLVGAALSGLLILELFLPHSIGFGESSVFVGMPRTVERIRYSKLARCEILPPPNAQVVGIGKDSQVLFEVFLDPRVDLESLTGLLSKNGVSVSRGTETAS